MNRKLINHCVESLTLCLLWSCGAGAVQYRTDYRPFETLEEADTTAEPEEDLGESADARTGNSVVVTIEEEIETLLEEDHTDAALEDRPALHTQASESTQSTETGIANPSIAPTSDSAAAPTIESTQDSMSEPQSTVAEHDGMAPSDNPAPGQGSELNNSPSPAENGDNEQVKDSEVGHSLGNDKGPLEVTICYRGSKQDIFCSVDNSPFIPCTEIESRDNGSALGHILRIAHTSELVKKNGKTQTVRSSKIVAITMACENS